jgi:hypothetical protein
VIDTLEWPREDGKLTPAQRDKAVGEVIELVSAVDGLLQAQSGFDAEYFLAAGNTSLTTGERERLTAETLKAYRWQYIFSGVEHPKFQTLLGKLTTDAQRNRLSEALAPLMQSHG